ncbi:condensin-2 complex subunit CAP-D3-like isoform X3 [Rutidosis leptorrhynchoides]|uniref:condensin-2 complex subunit CAP-D3-like isoform X3 n=1 Tax=Rutidosis leptorrhynchoides TaxID=125765 RepID=UPI003A999886
MTGWKSSNQELHASCSDMLRCITIQYKSDIVRGNDEKSRSQRMHIYVSLLKQMAPEHLLATFAKVCAEILASASDGMLKIEDVTCQSVLQLVLEKAEFSVR